MHLLQSVQWPTAPAFGVSELLYVRAEPRPTWTFGSSNGVAGGPVAPGAEMRLDFSTFFGAFSLHTWCGPAGLDDVVLEIECKGQASLEIYTDNGREGPQLVLQRRIAGDGRKQYVDVRDLKGRRGILFPVFVLQGGDALELTSLNYCTRTPPRCQPRLAIIMPTYKRERLAEQNVARLHAGLLARRPDCRLFVIDNGGSLELRPLPGVQVVRNPNYGGSGGFARGLLEVARAPEPFTHVLFCDDDVLINPESMVRLLALLGYVGDVVVSGGMLQMGARHILDQKSCYVVGIALSRNHGFQDLTELENVSRYDEPGFSSFCGWWFACYPLSRGPGRFMPLPYFIGWDDIEMGRRCVRADVPMISLLGVGIWHEEFEKKDRAWRAFYHVRNGIVTAMLYEPGRLALKQLFGEVVRSLQTYRYDRVQFMLDGLDAVLRGPAALRATRADELHQALVSRPQVQFTDVRKWVIPERLAPLKQPRMVLRTFWSRLTMNGHLLPLWLFKSAREPSFPGWVVEDLHSQARARIFRSRKVVYYESTTGYGMICAVDHGRYFRLLAGLLKRWLILRLRWRGLRDLWRSEHERLASPEFWCAYLGVPDAVRPAPGRPDAAERPSAETA